MGILLAFDQIGNKDGERSIAFLHGILGGGVNLRTIARRFVEARPDWSALLLDLRGHGRSPKGSPGPSIEAAALDVVRTVSNITPPAVALAGHSFGGKVALEAARLGGIASLRDVVVMDSVPGSRRPPRNADSAITIIETLESLPRRFESRTQFVEALLASGQRPGVAQWLAQSLENEDGGGVRFMLDLSEIRTLILDYSARDLWPVLEHPPDAVRIHVVIGERSDAFSQADRDRAFAIASSNERVTAQVLPAGHWVHVDDPDGLLRILLDVTGQ